MAPHHGEVSVHARKRGRSRLSVEPEILLGLANFLATRWPFIRKKRRYIEIFNSSGDLCGYVVFQRRLDRGISIITVMSDEMYPPRS